MRSLIAWTCAALALGAPVAAADDSSVVWTLLEVNTHIANDAGVHVRETHHVRLSGPVVSILHQFGRDTDQSVHVTGVWRVASGGERTPLEAGDPSAPSRYRAAGDYVEWNVQLAGTDLDPAPVFEIEYDLANAVSPAWNLGAGPRPLDGRGSIVNPPERWAHVWARWREARPIAGRAYRLDHDVLFPSRERPNDDLERLDYHMHYDDQWVLVTPEDEWARATNDVDYRVGSTFEYLLPARPALANVRNSAIRMGSIIGLPVAGLLLLAVFIAASRRSWSSAPIDRTWIQERLLNVPPNEIAADFGVDRGAATFEDVMNRMASDRKVRITVLRPETDDEAAHVEMRLLVSRDSLTPAERKIVDAVFFESNTTSTDIVRRRYRGDDFDPDELVAENATAATAGAKLSRWRPIASSLALAAGLSGVVLLAMDVAAAGQPPIALFGALVVNGVVNNFSPKPSRPVARPPSRDLLFLVPLVLLTLAMTAIHVATNASLSIYASAGMALFTLGNFQSMLNGSRPHVRGPEARRFAELARIRAFAERELRRERPALEDAWIPHLEAMGLADRIRAWRDRHAKTSSGVPGGLDMPSSPFTGRTTSASRSLPEDWAAGFYVFADDELPEDRAADEPEEHGSGA
jgi:hypothetical protein